MKRNNYIAPAIEQIKPRGQIVMAETSGWATEYEANQNNMTWDPEEEDEGETDTDLWNN